jgi:hypothetical protein
MFFFPEQTLAESGRRRAHEVDELRGEKAQLEMPLVVACVAAIAVVVSQVSSRAT